MTLDGHTLSHQVIQVSASLDLSPSHTRRGGHASPGNTTQPSTITDTLPLGQFETQLDNTVTLTDRVGAQRDVSDDEIERAIAEIQSTIQKYRK